MTIAGVLAIGAFVGFLNGFITTHFRLQSFITTLAMMSIARGVASLWADGYAIPISFGSGSGQAPPRYNEMFGGQLELGGLGIPAQVFYFLGVWIIASFLLYKTRFGRHVYAVGDNPVAARLSGINTNLVSIAVFAITGLLVGLSALLHTALVNQSSHIDGSGYELNAIAAVVIGIDGLPTPDGGLRSVIDGRIDVTYVYPTGGVEAIDWAVEILGGNTTPPKEVVLETIEVTSDNAQEVYEQFGGE